MAYKIRPYLFVIPLLFFSAFFSCSDKVNRLDEAQDRILKNVQYGPDSANRLDLYLPAGRKASAPLIVLIHGGAWVHGDKSEFYSKYASAFSKNKWVVANINYHLLSSKHDYKTILEDVKLALEFLQKKSGEYKFSMQNVHLLGYSAGGHIALLFAGKNNSANPIRSVISFAGPTNINDLRFKQVVEHDWNSAYIYPLLLGEEFKLNSEAAMDCSPVYHISNTPVLLIHGTADDVVPFYQALQLNDSLEKRHVPHRLLSIPRANHDVYYTYRDTIDAVLKGWIDRYGKREPVTR